MAAAEEALREVCGDAKPASAAAKEGSAERGTPSLGAGQVTCRFTHVYPDGPAPYYTVLAQARRGEEIEQWWAIKRAVSDAILREGGTITHHHAVGRDHRPWYDRQRPEPFAAALRAAKAAVDPQGIMNPGVLIDPRMRIAVLGPGGVGGLVAGALAHVGTPVSVIARESTVRCSWSGACG